VPGATCVPLVLRMLSLSHHYMGVAIFLTCLFLPRLYHKYREYFLVTRRLSSPFTNFTAYETKMMDSIFAAKVAVKGVSKSLTPKEVVSSLSDKCLFDNKPWNSEHNTAIGVVIAWLYFPILFHVRIDLHLAVVTWNFVVTYLVHGNIFSTGGLLLFKCGADITLRMAIIAGSACYMYARERAHRRAFLRKRSGKAKAA